MRKLGKKFMSATVFLLVVYETTYRVATAKEMIREKKNKGQGKFRF